MGRRKPGPAAGGGTEPQTVAGEIRALRLELSQVKRSRRFERVAMAFAALVIVGFIVSNRVAVNSVETETKNRQQVQLGVLVGVCAVQNITRIETQNMLTDTKFERPFRVISEAAFEAWYNKQFARFEVVDCKALAPKKDQVNLQLNYPKTRDPVTGEFVETKGSDPQPKG